MSAFSILIYLSFLLLVWLIYGYHKWKMSRNLAHIQAQEIADGLIEPPSLHPIIDPTKCLGCNACVLACPEKNVLGVIEGKAALIGPANCIGHGACRTACPFDAISLVFGTATRGIELPHVHPNFETNVPDIFIAGELGGMGLIRNAVREGSEAMAHIIQKLTSKNEPSFLDVIIVGAGPAGFAASLMALKQGLQFVTLEQEALGGTVAHYPRGKIVMTAPMELPLIGKTHFRETTKEKLMEFFQHAEQQSGLKIEYGQKVAEIQPIRNGFQVQTQTQEYKAQMVLLAIGRRGSPRKLGVTGEENTKVIYRLQEPDQFQDQKILVVGGGDSALEAAMSLSSVRGTEVHLSYRGHAFSRAKSKNREKIGQHNSEGLIYLHMESELLSINEQSVTLQKNQKETHLANDTVLVCAGGVLPDTFLKKIGVDMETYHGQSRTKVSQE